MTKREFARRLRARREAAGLTQRELADALGVSRQTINYWEGCRKSPPLERLDAICEALGVSRYQLLGKRGQA